MPVTLNAFRVDFSAMTFTANVLYLPNPDAMRALRERHSKEWFLHWRGGRAYAIPRVETPREAVGEPTILDMTDHDHLHVIVARLNDVLPDAFPAYEAFRRRPFSFLGRKDEIVRLVTRGWMNIPALVNDFKISPRFDLDPRIIELRRDETAVGLVLRVGMKWQILAPVEQLQAAGITLAGLAVIRRNPATTERRLVGTIAAIDGKEVRLAESLDNLLVIPTNQVWLEGSKASFARCLRQLLGSRYDAFETARWQHEGKFLLGPDLDRVLDKMGQFLTKASPITLAPGLSASINGRIEFVDTGEYQSVVTCDDVEYCFDSARSKRHIIPWSGLARFGPFSRETFSKRTPRILVVTPDESEGKVGQFVRAFRDGIQSGPNPRYPKGFASTFGLVNPEFVTCAVPVLGAADAGVAARYRKAIEDHLAAARDPYDAALVAILDRHATLPDAVNPYLHGKAALLMNGIPTQEIRHATLSARAESLQWSMQNLAVALYAKMGGTPWTVAHDLAVDDELVIGMGAAELSGSRFDARHRFMGITTVFRGDGNYLLSNVSRVCGYDDYPETLRRTTADVLAELKARNGWRDGDTIRIVFHAHKPLKRIEIARIVEECVQDAGKGQNIQFAFLTVSHDHPFKVFDSNQAGLQKQSGVRGRYAPARGTVAQLGRYTRLLSTNGPHQIKRPTTPLPAPLLVHLHRESGYKDLQYLTEQVLKFTSLTWRSTQPAHAPVTIYYSELIAGLLARLQSVPDWSPSVLNTKLRSSRWFL